MNSATAAPNVPHAQDENRSFVTDVWSATRNPQKPKKTRRDTGHAALLCALHPSVENLLLSYLASGR